MSSVAAQGEESTPGRFHEAFARPGVLSALSLLVGHAVASSFGITWWGVPLLLSLLPFTGLFAASRKGVPFVVCFCALFVGIGAVQQSFLQGADRRAFAVLEGVSDGNSPLARASGVIDSMPRRMTRGWTIILSPGSTLECEGRTVSLPAPVALRIAEGAEGTAGFGSRATMGDRIRCLGELTELPREVAVTGEPNDWLRAEGVVAIVRAGRSHSVSLSTQPGFIRDLFRAADDLANGIEELLLSRLPRREATLLIALTIGRTNLLEVELKEAYRRTGLMHLFSVSGLHTMLVGGLMIWLLRMLGLSPGPRVTLLVVLLVLFSALVGIKSAVLRAVMLLIVYESRDLLRRPVEPLAALGTIATALLILSPRAIHQVDFQMTFLCALTLVCIGPWMIMLQTALGRRLGWGWKSWLLTHTAQIFIVSCAIQIVLLPVFSTGFGEISLMAPIANALLIGLAGVCLQGAFLLLVCTAGLPGVGATGLSLLGGPLWLIDEAVLWLSRPGWASIAIPAWPLWATGLLYIAIVMSPLLRWHSATSPRRAVWQFVPLGLLVIVLLVWLPLLQRPPRGLQAWFLDVGQGDAILMRFPDGRTGLVDAGPQRAAWMLPRMLQMRGVRHLDFVVATHADEDHIGGLNELIENVRVDRLYVGGSLAATREFDDLRESVRRRFVPVTTLLRGAELSLAGGEVRIHVLHPTDEFLLAGGARNAASVVLRVEYAEHAILLTGDAEGEAEESMLGAALTLKSDVLKAGHHGSNSSTSDAFLNAVRPRLAIISCGQVNRYGHPGPALMERLANHQVPIRRTDQDGTVLVHISPDGEIRVSATREPGTAAE